jgi:hypothetical protein
MGLLSGIVAMPIERYQAIHGSDDKDLAGLIDELADWFCRDADPMFVAVSVVGFTAPGPLALAPGLTVRKTTDEEVSAMLEMGALNVGSNRNPTRVSITQVHEAARWVVAMDHSRPRRFGGSAQEEDEPDLSALEAAAGAWLAVLRILTPAEVRLGPTVTRQLVGGIPSGGSLKGYPRQPYSRGITRRPSRRTTLRRSPGSLSRFSAAGPSGSGWRTAFVDSVRLRRVLILLIASSTWSSRWNRCFRRAQIPSDTR